jgi:hypothetical protein
MPEAVVLRQTFQSGNANRRAGNLDPIHGLNDPLRVVRIRHVEHGRPD